MKVTNKITTGLIVGVIMLTISACGKSTTSEYTGAVGTYNSCNASATGDTVYTGKIISCSDVDGGCYANEIPVSGSLVLTVVGSSGVVSGQATINGALTVNGTTYCCSSQGMAILTAPTALQIEEFNATAVLDNIALVCQPSTTGTGYFGGYQAMTLKIGVGVYAPFTVITSDKRVHGDISITSGSSIGGYTNSLPELVE